MAKLKDLKLFLGFNNLGNNGCQVILNIVIKLKRLISLIIHMNSNNIFNDRIKILKSNKIDLFDKLDTFLLKVSDNPIDDECRNILETIYRKRIIF